MLQVEAEDRYLPLLPSQRIYQDRIYEQALNLEN